MTVVTWSVTYHKATCKECDDLAELAMWTPDMMGRMRWLDVSYDDIEDAEWAQRRHDEDWHS